MAVAAHWGWTEGAGSGAQMGFSVSPDGRSIAFQVGKSADEVWALENFLPTTTKGSR